MPFRPRLLDLFCGAGGCAVGYTRAGFDVVGVDVKPQPRYPFSFVRADALDYLAAHGDEFAAIHGSPPCQRFSVASHINGRRDHPDLVKPLRRLLLGLSIPWVIENVPGSPLVNPVTVCGLAVRCRVKRHRWFEASFPLQGTVCPSRHDGYVTVFGGGAPAKPDNRRRASAPVARAAMGIDWMTRGELAQAIPPAYTEFIGRQLLRHLRSRCRPRLRTAQPSRS